MAGFKAQRSQVGVNDAIVKAKLSMDRVIESDVRDDIGGDEQRVGNVQTNYLDITYKHILMPVWISAYRYRNRQFQVMVNAQTGQVLGERPWSVGKIAAAVMATVLVVGGGIWFFNQTKGSSSGYRGSNSTVIRSKSKPVKRMSEGVKGDRSVFS
jgi:hypothetical protein